MCSHQQKQPFVPPPQLPQEQTKQPQQPPPQVPFVPITKELCPPIAPQPGITKISEPCYTTVPEPCQSKVPELCPSVVTPDSNRQKTKQK
ncbi:Small proline-rich protein 3 [Heterocephalus glaber]|uniref:Small proline-rich protein 3 n=1 Tax=Heterocephalus glaber TaxID=10181 RepID=G5BUZ3_HETGA|nr:Small proline-rich protein 3 [Heterocephalus glaber]